MNKNEIIVSICCITYNHEPYIRQCLEGFMTQKTSFLFEVLIHDDASTDGTADIIHEYESKYPDIIKPIYQKENQYSKGVRISWVFNFPRAKGKYIALCEGDDYWIDPLKLQKQVDFLENNPEYGMVYSLAKIFVEKKQCFRKKLFGTPPKETFRELLYGNVIPTLSVVCKKQYIDSYIDEIFPYAEKWKMGDYPLWLYISKHSKIRCLDEITGVYRHLFLSMSHFNSFEKEREFWNSYYEIKYFFIEKYKENIDLVVIKSSYYTRLLRIYLIYNYPIIEYKELILKVEDNCKRIHLLKIISKCSILLRLSKLYWTIKS
ncbi:putative glycosyltransferase EpsE [termite gut metagenome]|uniref:Putative glycosyltransferase EpsE n=1 Tax=termite gut metagenome TaxID=433724 RepID=A0A5J4RZB4_9ZZZZ